MSVLREIKRVRLSEDLMFELRTKQEKDPVIWENKPFSGRENKRCEGPPVRKVW